MRFELKPKFHLLFLCGQLLSTEDRTEMQTFFRLHCIVFDKRKNMLYFPSNCQSKTNLVQTEVLNITHCVVFSDQNCQVINTMKCAFIASFPKSFQKTKGFFYRIPTHLFHCSSPSCKLIKCFLFELDEINSCKSFTLNQLHNSQIFMYMS